MSKTSRTATMLPWISVIVIGVWVAAAMAGVITKPHHQTVRSPGRSNAPKESGLPMPPEFKQLQDAYQKNIMASLHDGECRKERLTIRRSWDDLDDTTRAEYIHAVQCLASKPALTDKKLAPGVVNRLDDFTYIHINQTNIIHQSGYLLPWHRLFLWQMEQALRDECGYTGGLPYWDNARFSDDQTASRMWDGSATSFGGNGAPMGRANFTILLPGFVKNVTLQMPGGSGGGCVTDGPFRELGLSLGPVGKPVIDAANKYGYAANPRCLARSFELALGAGLSWANATAIVTAPDVAALRARVEGLWHRRAHTLVGGDAADPFSPTNDPVFYLLHAQIDRFWAIWQGQDLPARTDALDGNRTFFGLPLDYAPDVPPSPATLDDPMVLADGYAPLTKEGMPTTDRGRCYLYA